MENKQMEKMLRFMEGYKLDLEFMQDDIKSEKSDLEYNKKSLAESNSITDIEYYIEKIKRNVDRIKDLELKYSLKLNCLNTLEKINNTK